MGVSDSTPRAANPGPQHPSEDRPEVPLEQLSVEPPQVSMTSSSSSDRTGEVGIPDAPGLRPQTYPPMPPNEVLLDPTAVPAPIPAHRLRKPAPAALSPTMAAVFGALFGLAGIFAIFALLERLAPRHLPVTATSVSASAPPAASTEGAAASEALEPLPNLDDEPGLPGPWRVASMRDDEGVRVIDGTVGLDPLVETLESKHLSKKEIYRILAALKSFKVLDHPGRNSKYVVAVERSTSKVKAFELELSSTEIFQARENEQQHLVGEKLDMKVGSRRTVAGLRVGDDLPIDLRRARLRESVADVVDRALDGRGHLAGMPKGSTLRLVVVEQTALGRFASYEYAEALEFAPSREGSEPLRIYRVRDGNHWGYFDQHGREPFRGGWRRPCPGASITSGFNPKRLHPILHVIKPHLGTDFGAPTGTPIHACYYGQVMFLGVSGPAGNLVTIKHPGSIESHYMHMSRFSPGMKVGDKVETFQVIGYVGSTGRSTGPHLHFGIRKNGEWIDPMSLKLDSERTISRESREEFERVRAVYDVVLDSIPVPPPAPSATRGPSGVSSAEPTPSARPPEGVEETQDLDELEPEGTVDPNDKPDEELKKR